MKRGIAILALLALFALPAVVGAEVKLKPGSEEYFLLYGTTQPESLTKKGVITEQEPVEVSAPAATAPANAKAGQERDSSQHFRWAGVDGAVY